MFRIIVSIIYLLKVNAFTFTLKQNTEMTEKRKKGAEPHDNSTLIRFLGL